MDPTLEPLVRYISQEVAKGVPEPTIRGTLLQQGWTEQWLETAFAVIHMPPPTEAQPVSLPEPQAPLQVEAMGEQPVAVQQTPSQPIASTPPAQQLPQTQPMFGGTNEYGQPAVFMAAQPAVLPNPKQPNQEILALPAPQSRSKMWLKAVLIVVLLISLAAGGYYMLSYFQTAREQKAQRNIDRRHHLSIMLNDLSDYYVTHGVYPTSDQLNSREFQTKEGFDASATRDPQWTAQVAACTKDNVSIFAATPTKRCYSYVATTSEGGTCSKDTLCKKMAISIFPEGDDKPYVVTFDQNSEIDE